MSHVVVNPEADLPPRAGDELPPAELLEKLQLFAVLKKKPSFDKFPNSVVLRHFRPGEVICRQGDAGASAYYILSTEDLVALRTAQGRTEALGPLQAAAATLADQPPQAPGRQRLTAHLFLAEERPRPRRGAWFGAPRTASPATPRSIAIDGPIAIDMATRRAPLFEGEVFGEMSCMTMAPRSATVVADTECYLLEFLRHIFDHIQRDAGYQQRLDAMYRERVLTNHLKRLELLADVADDDLALLREQAELMRAEPGQIIFDQGDRSDAVYLIRSGLVQVVTDPHLALRPEDVLDPPALGKLLVAATAPEAPVTDKTVTDQPAAGKPSAADMLAAMKAKKEAAAAPAGETPAAGAEEKPTPAKPSAAAMLAAAKASSAPTAPPLTPLAHLWQRLDPAAQAAARQFAAAAPDAELAPLLAGLNAALRDRAWLSAKPLEGVLEHADVARQTRTFPKGIKGLAKDWADLEVRVAGRVALELLLAPALRRRPGHAGTPRVLSYLSRGDIFGEIGVLEGTRRTATCLAYDHPPDPSRNSVPVDLVRIPADAFRAFVERSPVVKRRVDAILRQRRASDDRRAEQPRWRGDSALVDSPDFQQLGLIQGQKLLLIDLDRCTRCGDCVRACIETHDDGRSRLYLDGPRFDKYLVPSACRNCLNPACMIGCPVGSIQRGGDGQIEIRDWCIGCGMCADQCPYDSIQMHDLGLVPNRGIGWRVAPASAAGSNWRQPRFADTAWPIVSGPVDWGLDLQMQLATFSARRDGVTLEEPICFRHTFTVPVEQLLDGRRHEFSLVTQGAGAEVWLNGEELALEGVEKRHRDKTKKTKGRWFETLLPAGALRRGENVLAIQIAPPVAAGEGVLDVQIVPGAGELALGAGHVAEVKQVTERAVVCDLCSALPTGPACVTMCPHDAALRVDARAAFPGA